MQETLKDTIAKQLGSMLHYLGSIKPQPGDPMEDFAYHQVLTNILEESYFKIDRILTPRISEDVVPDTQTIRIPRRVFKEIAGGVVRFANKDSEIMLIDDGYSFQALLTLNEEGDSRQIFNSESLQ
jgi:hypothetical protein